MDQFILRALAAEVQRRPCPGCDRPLERADISTHFSNRERVQLHFRCRFCAFEGGGEIEITPEIHAEASRNARAEERAGFHATPITADELLLVHESLGAWESGFSGLLAESPA